MEQVSVKTALVIYIVIIPVMVVTGYLNNILLMSYFTILFMISLFLTIFEKQGWGLKLPHKNRWSPMPCSNYIQNDNHNRKWWCGNNKHHTWRQGEGFQHNVRYGITKGVQIKKCHTKVNSITERNCLILKRK